MNVITYFFLIPSTISVVFILCMIARYCQLKSDIIVDELKLNCSIKFRITLIIMDIGIINSLQTSLVSQLCEISLIFYCKQCYEYHDYSTFIIIINISTLILQVILMIYEYNKRIPLFFAHKIYWMLIWICLLILFGLNIHLHTNTYINSLLLIFRFSDISILLIYTLFIRRQDFIEFEEIGFFNSEIPEINIKESQRPRISTVNFSHSQFIEIEIQKKWNIIDDQVEFKLKLLLKEVDKQYTCKRNLTQFFQMHQQLVFEKSDYFDNHNNELQLLNNLIQLISDSQGLIMIQNIQKYFHQIVTSSELFCKPLMDFIDLPQQERDLIEDIKQQNRLNKSSIVSIKKVSNVSQKKWNILPNYLPYMNIKIQNHSMVKQHNDSYIKYFMIARIGKENVLSQKRFREYLELYENYKQIGVKYLPPFPQKSMIKLSEQEIEERKKDLEIFIKVLINDRSFHNNLLFHFLGLTNLQQDFIKQQYSRIVQESNLISNIQIKMSGFEETIDNSNEKFYKYNFTIEINHNQYNIWKRYSQFDEFHSIIKHKYSLLPSLPQKVILQQQQNPNSRSVALLNYLYELLKIQGIGEDPHFRQFLEIKNIYLMEKPKDELDIHIESPNDKQLDEDVIQIDLMKERLWV